MKNLEETTQTPASAPAARPAIKIGRLVKPLNLLWLLAFVLLAAKLLFSLNIIWQIFNFAFQVDESESMIVSETLLMNRGVDIYARPGPELFISAPYTPFYYLLNWPFLHFMGSSFKPGRLISFLAACGIAFILYCLVRVYAEKLGTRAIAGRLSGLLAGLAWGSLGLVAFWGGAVKPDVTALFLSLSGLYLIFTGNFEPAKPEEKPVSVAGRIAGHLKANRRLYAAALLFALAALTKQTAFAGIGVALLWLILTRAGGSYFTALRFLGLYLFLAFAPMLLMNLTTQGGFWYHIVTVHELPWSFQNYIKFLGGMLQSYQVFALLALAFALLWLAETLFAGKFSPGALWLRLRNNSATFFVLYLGAAFGASLSAGTYGGNHNHLLELAAAICLGVGALLVYLQKNIAGKSAWRKALPVAALALVCWQGVGLFLGEARITPDSVPLLGSVQPTEAALAGVRQEFLNPDWLGLEYRAPLPEQKQRLAEVAAFLNNDQGKYIYSDNVSLVLATTKPLFTTDPFTQTHATRYGRWDQSFLLEMVRNQQFSLIALRRTDERSASKNTVISDIYLSPELAQAMSENYRLACHDAAVIYVPKNRKDFKGC
ncbi:MAG TPA: hypothetical protein VH186_17795 [Chloroflexia bacterium]|nr:hypothetical protein [Chloroflexia bacterium]